MNIPTNEMSEIVINDQISSSKSPSVASCKTQQKISVLPPSPPPTPHHSTPPQPSTQAQVVQDNDDDQSMIANVTATKRRLPIDYNFLGVIGMGSYSTVYVAEDIHVKRIFAIKVCKKQHILREQKREQIHREKDILNILSSTGSNLFVKLYCTFQDNQRLYFVMSYAINGDMLPYINSVREFDMACTRFYSGEIICALEYMHDLNIMHRDLKPENILLDENMHIKVADFGCSKIFEQCDDTSTSISNENNRKRRNNSFVGTARYVSPEILTKKISSPSSDLWAFGCIIYQMIAGIPPFRSKNRHMLYKNIQKLNYEYPEGFNKDAKDLIQKLLVYDPNERLGIKDNKRYTSIRSHPFYNGLDFDTLLTSVPPLRPLSSRKIPGSTLISHNLKLSLDSQQTSSTTTPASVPTPRKLSGILNMNGKEKQHKVHQKTYSSKWLGPVEGNEIVQQGLVNKRDGFFTKKRILMLTMGPHLYYADPVTMTLKGEIPWSPKLRVEPKNVSTFYILTDNKIYILEDLESYALKWCRAIEKMKVNSNGMVSTTST